MKTKRICVVTLIVECEKVVPDLTDLIAGRAYTIDGVCAVTASQTPLMVPYSGPFATRLPTPGLSEPFMSAERLEGRERIANE